jgi:hypothetical protein
MPRGTFAISLRDGLLGNRRDDAGESAKSRRRVPGDPKIETAGSYEKSELAADHHRTTLARGVDRRRFTWRTLAPRDDRSCSDSRTMKPKELR